MCYEPWNPHECKGPMNLMEPFHHVCEGYHESLNHPMSASAPGTLLSVCVCGGGGGGGTLEPFHGTVNHNGALPSVLID